MSFIVFRTIAWFPVSTRANTVYANLFMLLHIKKHCKNIYVQSLLCGIKQTYACMHTVDGGHISHQHLYNALSKKTEATQYTAAHRANHSGPKKINK